MLSVILHTFDQQIIYGVRKKTNDKYISKDIKILSKKYASVTSMRTEQALPYFVLSRNYDEQSGDFELFIGSTIQKDGLESFELPSGKYARITIKPKMGFLWGLAIGEVKRYFYKKWLPQSAFKACNMEYEYHTERSVGKYPTIDMMFAIEKK